MLTIAPVAIIITLGIIVVVQELFLFKDSWPKKEGDAHHRLDDLDYLYYDDFDMDGFKPRKASTAWLASTTSWLSSLTAWMPTTLRRWVRLQH